MQLTINSSEPLDQVLEVLGALYGVRLTRHEPQVASAEEASPAPAEVLRPASRRRATTQTTPNRRARSTRTSDKVDVQAVRAWARQQGRTVSDRGRLPQSLIEEYRQAAA